MSDYRNDPGWRDTGYDPVRGSYDPGGGSGAGWWIVGVLCIFVVAGLAFGAAHKNTHVAANTPPAMTHMAPPASTTLNPTPAKPAIPAPVPAVPGNRGQ